MTELNHLVLVFAVGFIASTLSNIMGHGGALLLLPLLGYLLPPKEVIGVAMLYYLTLNVARILVFRRHIVWWVVRALTIGAVPAVFAGILCIYIVPAPWVKIFIGTFIIGDLVWDLRPGQKLASNKPSTPKKPVYTANLYGKLVLLGIPYGFLSGLLSSGSIVRTAFLVRIGLVKQSFMATTAMSSLFVNIPKIISYSELNFLGKQHIPAGLALGAAAIAGSFFGAKLLTHISVPLFQKLVFMVLFILAVLQIIEGAAAL